MEDLRRRAARREFIRTHHPDRGGDPAVFAQGLRRLTDPARATSVSPVTFYRRPRGLARLARPARRLAHLFIRPPTPPRVR